MNDSTKLKPLRVLLIEDSPDDAMLVVRQLQKSGLALQTRRVETREELLDALNSPWDIVFSDYSLPRFNGMEALNIVRERDPEIPFIIVSGTIGEERAVTAMKCGAHDYIMKDNIQRLIPAVERELKEAELRLKHRRAQERIAYLAYYDPVTDLPNRTHFLDFLGRCILNEGKTKTGVLICELTYYHEINTTLGYAIGDALVRAAGARINDQLPQGALLASLGSGRFAAVLPGLEADGMACHARDIRQGFDKPFDVQPLRLSTGIVLGSAHFPQHGREAFLLLQHAEIALVLARKGAEGYFLYDPSHDPSPENLSLTGDLREALSGRMLKLQYQPKRDLRTGRVTGVEALSRWDHPSRGSIPPERFVLLAEKSGLIMPLTYWLLDTAMDQSRAWERQQLEMRVAVNFSARNLQDPHLMPRLETLMQQHGNGGSLGDVIDVELTESALMEDPEQALKTLNGLRALGVSIYIDDFGTGYSSLSYLQRLPIDAVKIDKSFIQDIQNNKDAEIIVRSTIDLAHHLGLEVVAEGVENEATLEMLKQLDCDVAQGYFISKPMDAADFEHWCATPPGHGA